MKISEFKNGDAIDLLADLIDPVSELITKEPIRQAILSDKPKLIIAKECLKNGKDELIQIFALLDGIPIEEYTCTPVTILRDLLILLNDPDLQVFFTDPQMMISDGALSSVAESTEADEH